MCFVSCSWAFKYPQRAVALDCVKVFIASFSFKVSQPFPPACCLLRCSSASSWSWWTFISSSSSASSFTSQSLLSSFPPSLSLSWCTHECVQVCAHVYASPHSCVPVWSPEGDFRRLPQMFANASAWGRNSNWAQSSPFRPLCVPVLNTGVIEQAAVCDFRFGSGDLNSAPHDCTASALAVEPSPRSVIRMLVVP